MITTFNRNEYRFLLTRKKERKNDWSENWKLEIPRGRNVSFMISSDVILFSFGENRRYLVFLSKIDFWWERIVLYREWFFGRRRKNYKSFLWRFRNSMILSRFFRTVIQQRFLLLFSYQWLVLRVFPSLKKLTAMMKKQFLFEYEDTQNYTISGNLL